MTIKTYLAPSSLDEAVAALASEGAIPFAGGTDIIPQTQAGRAVATVVDLKGLAALNVIERRDDAWIIGAAVPCHRIDSHPALRTEFPGLVEGAALIGSTQIQGRATLGGNVGNASPAADTVPALLANHASVDVVGPDGERSLAVADLITGPGRTSLGQGEFMVRFVVPVVPGSADAAMRFTPRTEMDIAVANAAVRIVLDPTGTCRQADVAIGGVGPKAVLVEGAGSALVGLEHPTDDAVAQVAEACRRAASPIDDKRGTAHFRRHAIGVLASRALVVAWRRAADRKDHEA